MIHFVWYGIMVCLAFGFVTHVVHEDGYVMDDQMAGWLSIGLWSILWPVLLFFILWEFGCSTWRVIKQRWSK